MDQRLIAGEIIQDNKGHLNTGRVHLRDQIVILSDNRGIEGINLPVVVVVDAAARAQIADRQIPDNLVNAHVCQQRRIARTLFREQALLAAVSACGKTRRAGFGIHDIHGVADRSGNAAPDGDHREFLVQIRSGRIFVQRKAERGIDSCRRLRHFNTLSACFIRLLCIKMQNSVITGRLSAGLYDDFSAGNHSGCHRNECGCLGFYGGYQVL